MTEDADLIAVSPMNWLLFQQEMAAFEAQKKFAGRDRRKIRREENKARKRRSKEVKRGTAWQMFR